ncbi:MULTISPECIES: hypothetical protein [Enterobacteriaceae]|uniref:hypothetical protein n=1 Tax=Enterobacteriaceae TaxID=543 RepID=UPI001FD7A7D9|nr:MULTISPECIES: hypothetical protein [Enterobacteriaceae]
MRIKLLVALSASVLFGAFSAISFAQALPANPHAGRLVLNKIPGNYTQSQILEFCSSNNVPLKPVGPLQGSNEFCVMAFSAHLTDKAIAAIGYSTQDTISKIAKDYGISYQRAGLGDVLLPFSGLASFPEGQDFLVSQSMMRTGDRSLFNKTPAIEGHAAAGGSVQAAANLAVECGKYSIKIYPGAIFLNGNKMDYPKKQTESDVSNYFFQEFAEMGGTYTLYSLDIPARGGMTLSHQWQDADGNALRDVKTEKCGTFKSFSGEQPNKQSTLERQQAG